MSGPWEGAQNIPVTNSTMSNNFGVIAFPGTVGGPSTFGQGNYNIIPKGAAHPAQAFEFMTWLAGFDNESFISTMLPKGGWMPTSPQVASQPTFKSWASANSWLGVFIEQMSSPLSQTPKLTASESAFETAETTASEAIAEKSETWQQALTYIDNQANNTTGG